MGWGWGWGGSSTKTPEGGGVSGGVTVAETDGPQCPEA